MSVFSFLRSAAAALFHRSSLETEMDEELRAHMEDRTNDLERSGVPRAEAERRARLEFGGYQKCKEECREALGAHFVETLLQDIRYGLRVLRKSSGFTAVAVLTLALGIGATTSIFSVVEAVLLRPLPYKDPARIVLFTDPQSSEDGGFLLKDFNRFRAQSKAFDDLAIFYRDSGLSRIVLTRGVEPQQVQGAFVSASFFSLMGVSPILGRVFGAQEENRHEPVVVLSYGFWINQFGGSPDVLGKNLALNGRPFQIIGVMPEEFQLPARDQVLWLPITTNYSWDDPAVNVRADPLHSRFFFERWKVVGRLARDVRLQQAQTETNLIFNRIAQSDPDPFRGQGIELLPLHVELSRNTRLALLVLLGAVCFVLFIACSNVANLTLAKGVGRSQEMAIRTALGARRGRLITQLLVESLLLALAAALVGLGLAEAAIRVFIVLAPPDIPRLEETSLDTWALIFTLGISTLSSILFGLVPALFVSKDAVPNAASWGSRRSAGSPFVRRARGLLTIAELSLAVVLLTGAGLMVRSFTAVESADPGFRPEHVLTLHMSAPQASSSQLASLHASALEHLRALPSVESVGAINDLFEPSSPNILGLRAIEGRAVESRDLWVSLIWKTVSGDYFQAMGSPLLKGRYFTDADGPNSPLVAIIDESMARRYWPNSDPLGGRIKGQDPRGKNDDWVTIIGVVHDMRRSGLEHAPTAHVFEWYRQSGVDKAEDFVLRTTGDDPHGLESAMRSTLRQLDPTAILSSVSTLEGRLSEQLAPRRFQTSLLGCLSLIALALAGIGIFGLIHNSVAQRTHEIGIRMALGAEPGNIMSLILREGLRLTLVGVVTGLAASLALGRVVRSLLYETGPADPATLVFVSLALALVALGACYIPARRAMRVDPMVALRYE
jgi:predicted permease